MNRKTVLILPVLFFWLTAPALFSQQSRFDEANERMAENQVEDALELYRSIEADGFRSGKLYFNMGIAAIHQDSLGLAKFYLLQSRQFEQTHHEAEQALRLINDQFDRHSAILPRLPWERFTHWLFSTFGIGGLFGLGVLMLNLGTGGVIGSWFAAQGNRFLRITGYTAASLALVLFLTSFYLNYQQNRFSTAVQVSQQAVIHQQPDEQSALISRAYEGYTMRLDRSTSKKSDDWYYIRLQNGMYGWIPSENIRSF